MPTPQAQFTACWHYTSKRGALKLSLDGNPDHAQWVPGSQCSVYHINRKAVVVTMPEWLAVKIGFMPRGVLPFGDKVNAFTDKGTAGRTV